MSGTLLNWCWRGLFCLSLLVIATGPVAAQAEDEASPPPDPLQTAVDALKVLSDALRPDVEALEQREEPPTAEEMQDAAVYVDRLNAAIEQVETLAPADGKAESSGAAKAARKLLRRVAALDLVRRAAELRAFVDELAARDEPPSADELSRMRQEARDLHASVLELEAESAQSRKEAKEAEQVIAISETIDVMAEAEQHRDALEEAEQRPGGATDSEADTIRQAANELQQGIEQAEKKPIAKKGEESPVGLRRARGILNRLLVLVMREKADSIAPIIERLENAGEPPSDEALAGLSPPAIELHNGVKMLEESLRVVDDEALRPELTRARELLYRAALLKLWKAYSDAKPVVEELEGREEPLTTEEVARLRAIPPDMRPAMREAREMAQGEWPETDDGSPPLIVECTQLLRRVEALVPDSPSVVEEPTDAPETNPVKRFFRFYGSLRGRVLVAQGEGTEFDGQTSRVGVRAEGELFKTFTGFARAELGFNFFEATEVLISGDPGRVDSDTESIFFPRLFFIGGEVGGARISYGKQWSAYYDVAVFSDQLPYLAGAGTGTYNAESDGGFTGTGRADQVLQYRDAIKGFRFTAQMQIRNLTENNQPLADTVGGSVTWKARDTISVGAGFNTVRDGVPDPEVGQPKQNDRAIIVGARHQTDRLYAAGTLSIFNNHETDDEGEFFTGIGVELYAAYDLLERLKLRGALSLLKPESGYPGQFQILSITPAISYDLTERIRLLLIGRLDASTLKDGSDRNTNVISAAVFYNF